MLAGTHLVWRTVGAVVLVRVRVRRVGWLLVLTSLFGAVAMASWATLATDVDASVMAAPGPLVTPTPVATVWLRNVPNARTLPNP